MTVTVKHSKTNAISDWTQAQLDEQIALGNFAEGTVLADIVLPSDWNDDHTLTGVGTMAEQNANSVAITGGSINGTTIGATTASTGRFTSVTTPSVTASSTDLTLSAISTGVVNLNTAGGTQAKILDTTTSGSAYWTITGSSGGFPFLSVDGTNPNINAVVASKGSGAVRFYTNGTSSGVLQALVSHTASAVNYVQVTGGATGNNPTISAQGSDANINVNLTSKGTGTVLITRAGSVAAPALSLGGANRGFYDLGTGEMGVVGSGWEQFRFGNTTSAVNYLRVNGGATTNAPILSAQGTDTNISMAFQPKGTGAIDLAAGSSGVNISNGGTVTAVTLTNAGTGYTSFPTATIAVPTTAGGVQGVVSFTRMYPSGYTLGSGGTGYTVNDVLTIVGGTPVTTAAQLTVSAVSGGVITAVTVSAANSYTVLPTNPVSVTGGTGTGAKFNLTYSIGAATTISNAGSGYIEQPTVTFSGGGGSGASAYATVGSSTTVRSLNATMSFNTPPGESVRINNGGFSTLTDYVELRGGASVSGAYVTVGGSTANANLYLSSKASANLQFYTNSFNQEQFRVSHTASAVNYVQVTGSATGGRPIISVQGSDTNAGMNYYTKGFGSHQFLGYNGANIFLNVIAQNANPVNYIQLGATSSGNALQIQAQGTDTNIDLNLAPKGTGKVNATNTTSSIVQSTGSSGYGSFLASSSTGNSAFYFGYVNNTEVGRISMTSSNNMSFATSSSALEQFRVSNTASAVNYVQVTGAATTGTPVVQAQGSDTNVSLAIRAKGAGNLFFQPNSLNQFAVIQTASAVNYLTVTGATTTNFPTLSADGSDTNIGLNIQSKLAAPIRFFTSGGFEQMRVNNTASAVNYVQVTGSATGVQPVISAQGSDANIALTLRSKGTFACEFGSSAGTVLFQAIPVASSVNYLQASPAIATASPSLTSAGTDTNIDLTLTPKGTGVVQFGTHTANADTAISGYITIRDAGGTLRKLAVIT